jgi:aminoglycoside phosphotransferase (APT) family kinase protein
MHPGELAIDAMLVHRLVGAQFARYAELAIRPVSSTGTVNAIYRLGHELCVRLPRLAAWEAELVRECDLLPRLAGRLPVQIPEVVGVGRPAGTYPFAWGIHRWIDGEPYADELVEDEAAAARDLAGFVADLRRIEVDPGAPRAGREPLRALDGVTRAASEAAGDLIDVAAAVAAWERALEAPAWDGSPAWIHGDLLRPNLLVRDGRLAAVIDFGATGVGDPATDLVAAWSVFGPVGREVFREALEPDDATWARARGIALHQAALIVPYYSASNPAFAAEAIRTIEQVVAD